MKKINKNGWGLQTELLFILLFLICIIIAIVGINRFGLLGYINLPYMKDNNTNYKLIEEDLVASAKDYIHEVYNNNLGEGSMVLRVNHLVKNNYLEEIKDKKGNICSGYVEVIKTQTENIVYYPYLKCKEYQTFEYDESKDW